jgi:uncharacterized protein (DUF2141 family)
MSRRIALMAALFLGAASYLPATAQTVTVDVTGVHSSTGSLLAGLCDNPAAQFPGGCMTYSAMASARQGTTTLVFNDVKPGTYALQVFHDEDGNMFPNIPPEGYAFGNSQQYPPSYEGASFKVAGDTRHVVEMTYMQGFGAVRDKRPKVLAFLDNVSKGSKQ